jgi:hypothetical protein
MRGDPSSDDVDIGRSMEDVAVFDLSPTPTPGNRNAPKGKLTVELPVE